MKIESRRISLYVGVAVATVILALISSQMGFTGSREFHQNICVISAMISLFTGLLSLVRYYSRPVCPYLWIGIAFLGNGIIELVYIYGFSFYSVFNVRSALPDYMVWGWWLSKLYLSVMLLGACLTCIYSKSLSQSKEAYGMGVVLLVICLSVLLYTRLPNPLMPWMITRPLEYIPGCMFAICLMLFLKGLDWEHKAFPHWLIIGTIITCGVQLLIIPLSQNVYDARFIISNVLRVLAHIFVAIGLLSEIFTFYGLFQEETNKLLALRFAVSQVKDYALFMVDPEGFILTWNAGAQHIKGYSENEILGKNFSIFFTRRDKEANRPQQELSEALETGHVVEEGWRVRKDGSKFWAYVIITPVFDNTGELLGYYKVTRDLTERKQFEEELRKQNEMLSNTNEQLSQFAYIATHDLKEPLRTISSFTQLLTRICKHCDEKAEVYSDFITTAVDRIRKLIDDLRTYSIIRGQGGEHVPVDLTKCLEDALNLLNRKIEDSNTRITHDHLPTVNGSAIQLMYLFLHIIDNAIKYSRHGVAPEVIISCQEHETQYIISIRDNGIGISQEHADKLFSIFHKLDNRAGTEGSGIGLSICKKIVAAHGGTIWFTSADNGTTFYFSLPIISLQKPA